MRKTLARLHIWIGWLIAVPLLLWCISGLWMVARPIEEVRGEHLVAVPAPFDLPTALTPPDVGTRAMASVAVGRRDGRAVWTVRFVDGGVGTASLATGAALPPASRTEAISAALRHLKRPASIEQVTRTSAEAPPIDLRRARPAWRVEFADGARVYVDADTGAVLALRTRQWRVFDFMWGLHILAPREREATSHAVLIAAAALALLTVVAGTLLLPRRANRRVNRSGG